MHLSPTLWWKFSGWSLEISHDGNIYTTEIGKCCKSGHSSLPLSKPVIKIFTSISMYRAIGNPQNLSVYHRYYHQNDDEKEQFSDSGGESCKQTVTLTEAMTFCVTRHHQPKGPWKNTARGINSIPSLASQGSPSHLLPMTNQADVKRQRSPCRSGPGAQSGSKVSLEGQMEDMRPAKTVLYLAHNRNSLILIVLIVVSVTQQKSITWSIFPISSPSNAKTCK